MAEHATQPADGVGPFRALASSVLQFRSRIAEAARITFNGRRNVGQILGYENEINPKAYRQRYERNELAGRVVEKAAQATWRAGAELIEDPAPEVVTPFEEAWMTLAARVNLWSIFYRADVLSGLGEYSVMLIGAKGALDQPLPRMTKQEDVMYLLPYGQEEVQVQTYEDDPSNARFGLPLSYRFQRLGRAGQNVSVQRIVHWTRVLHIADGLLDDPIHGQPRLRRIWNRLDDLDKVVGGGSEAFWMRAHQGLQFNIDPEVRVSEPDRQDMLEQIDKFAHGMQRTIRTRGMNIETLGSDVADFSGPAAIIVDLIAAGTGIPKRILMGSERGELASTQDRENWDAYVEDRRVQFAEPILIRQFADRLIEYGALPKPTQYEARWPEINSLTEDERSLVAERWAKLNTNMGETVVTPDEIRDRVLLLPPISDEDRARFEPPDDPVAGAPGNGAAVTKAAMQRLRAAKEAIQAALANA